MKWFMHVHYLLKIEFNKILFIHHGGDQNPSILPISPTYVIDFLLKTIKKQRKISKAERKQENEVKSSKSTKLFIDGNNWKAAIAKTLTRQQRKWRKWVGCNGNHCTAAVTRRAASTSAIEAKNRSNKSNSWKSLADSLQIFCSFFISSLNFLATSELRYICAQWTTRMYRARPLLQVAVEPSNKHSLVAFQFVVFASLRRCFLFVSFRFSSSCTWFPFLSDPLIHFPLRSLWWLRPLFARFSCPL